MGRNFVLGVVFQFFSKQNQIPHIIIGMGLEIYHFEAFLVVIWKKKHLQNFSDERNRFEFFEFWSNFELIR